MATRRGKSPRETRLRTKRLRKAWRDHEAAHPRLDVPSFEAGGLVLGAGTVLAKAGAFGAAWALDGADERLETLLAVAYGGAVTHEALRQVKAAAARWDAGDKAAAGVHLALSRLGRLGDPAWAARRLFIADGLMRAGVEPGIILEVVGAETAKAAPHDVQGEARVLAGNGRLSGRWTTGGGTAPGAPAVAAKRPKRPAQAAKPPSPPAVPGVGVGRMGPALSASAMGTVLVAGGRAGAGLDLGAMSGPALRRLVLFAGGVVDSGAFAAGLSATGAFAVLGILFIPATGPKGKWISVGGPGDVSYYQNPDELAIHFRYTGADGIQRTIAVLPDPHGNYRGPSGDIIARAVKVAAKYGLVISTAALVDSDQPKLCPASQPDKMSGVRGRPYEDYMKQYLNPGNPTPSGMAYYFVNPRNGTAYAIDDCQQSTGALAEYKGETYEKMVKEGGGLARGVDAGILNQANNQFKSKGTRTLIWFFSEEYAADHYREMFKKNRLKINVEWVPGPNNEKK